MIYEPILKKICGGSEIPDFVLRAYLKNNVPTTITEVKPHLLKILQTKYRKAVFLQNFQQALVQAADYNRFLNTRHGRMCLEELLGETMKELSFTLLASNNDEYERAPE